MLKNGLDCHLKILCTLMKFVILCLIVGCKLVICSALYLLHLLEPNLRQKSTLIKKRDILIDNLHLVGFPFHTDHRLRGKELNWQQVYSRFHEGKKRSRHYS